MMLHIVLHYSDGKYASRTDYGRSFFQSKFEIIRKMAFSSLTIQFPPFPRFDFKTTKKNGKWGKGRLFRSQSRRLQSLWKWPSVVVVVVFYSRINLSTLKLFKYKTTLFHYLNLNLIHFEWYLFFFLS